MPVPVPVAVAVPVPVGVPVAVSVTRCGFTTYAHEHMLSAQSCIYASRQISGRVPAMHSSIDDFEMPNEEQVHLAAESFRLLADPTRIRVLWALLQGESSVACLAELTGAAPAAVSQHLAKLRLAGLVRGRREGTFVYYSAADHHVRKLLDQALFHADHLDRDLPN